MSSSSSSSSFSGRYDDDIIDLRRQAKPRQAKRESAGPDEVRSAAGTSVRDLTLQELDKIKTRVVSNKMQDISDIDTAKTRLRDAAENSMDYAAKKVHRKDHPPDAAEVVGRGESRSNEADRAITI